MSGAFQNARCLPLRYQAFTIRAKERRKPSWRRRTSDAGAGGVRARIRANDHAGPTSDVAPGFMQANLVALPEEYAFDFPKFCVRNPKPWPILEVAGVGLSESVVTAPGADLRTDVPRYRVYKRGELVEEPPDIPEHWRDDLVFP